MCECVRDSRGYLFGVVLTKIHVNCGVPDFLDGFQKRLKA